MTHQCRGKRLLTCGSHPRWRVLITNWRDGKTAFTVVAPPDQAVKSHPSISAALDAARTRRVQAVQDAAA